MDTEKNKTQTFQKKSFSQILSDNKFSYLAFLLAAVIALITFAVVEYFPFGNNTILRVDLYHQYAPFHEEFRSKLLNGESLFYSWQGGMGKELISQIAYYTSSPVSFLILLFPQSLLPEAMAVFALIKISFSAAFFAYYLRKTFNKNDISITAFSLFYAFMAYMTCYYWNIMWLDAIALFPLVALGIESLVNEGKYRLYCLCLALTIIINFYIAFLVCIFAVLYYIVKVFSVYSWKKDRKIIIQRTIAFFIISAIAGGISMFLTIPTAIALSHTQASDSSFPTLKVYDNVYQLITNHFFASRPVVLARNEDLPNVYTGVLTMLLLPLYFFNKRIKTKEKVLYGIFIIFMLACSCINTFDYMIHGMHFPSNLPHRYTFIYSFVILTLAYKAFVNIKDVNLSVAVKAFIAYMAIILLTEWVVAPNNAEVERVISDTNIGVNAVIMIIYMVFLTIYKSANRKELGSVLLALAVLTTAETCASSIYGFKYVGTTNREAYVKYMDNAEEMLQYMEDYDADKNENNKFYRQEFRRFTTINDAALYHYRGFSIFSSLAYGNTSQLMENIGIAATSNSYRYYDPTPLIDAIFNLKYVMNKDGEIKNDDYTLVKEFDNVSFYENKYYLPLGFMTNSSITDWAKTEDYDDDKTAPTPFELQNSFINKAVGIDGDILNDIPVTDFKYENIKITDTLRESSYKYELTEPDNLGAIPKVTAKVHNDEEKRIFIYVDAGNAKRFKYTINGATQDRELSTGRSTIDCGIVPADTDISIEFTLDRKGEYEKTYRKSGNIKLYAASFDYDTFDRAFEQMQDEPYVVTEFDDTHLKGTINARQDGIMYTSVPYDKGWKIKLDGQKTDIVPLAFDGLIGIEVPEGEHTIEFEYKAQGFALGCGVTVLSIIVFIGIIIYDKKKKRGDEAADEV